MNVEEGVDLICDICIKDIELLMAARESSTYSLKMANPFLKFDMYMYIIISIC